MSITTRGDLSQFLQPLEDFDFDSALFSKHALALTTSYAEMSDKAELDHINQVKLEKLASLSA